MTPEQQKILQSLTPEQKARLLEILKRKRIEKAQAPNDARARIEACDRRSMLYAKMRQMRG